LGGNGWGRRDFGSEMKAQMRNLGIMMGHKWPDFIARVPSAGGGEGAGCQGVLPPQVPKDLLTTGASPPPGEPTRMKKVMNRYFIGENRGGRQWLING